MAKLHDTLSLAMTESARQGLVDWIRNHPETTLGELIDLLKGDWGEVVTTIRVGELMVVRKGGKAAAASEDEVNTRTPAGRRAFDERVIKILKQTKTPISATEVRKLTGGTPLQVRTALNRLIEQGRIAWTGKARGTRYKAA